MKETEFKTETILGLVPSKSNGYRISGNRLFKTSALSNYENAFFMQSKHYRNANIKGYFEIFLKVFYPNQRSDLDGMLKVVLDCLQKIKAFENDNKCTKIIAEKFLDKANPRIEFFIKPVF